MNKIVPHPPSETAVTDNADLCGMFVVDAGGAIVAVNHSACAIFGSTGRSMVGMDFASLLACDESADRSEGAAVPWAKIKHAAHECWTAWSTVNGSAPFRQVWVRVERAVGGAGTYIATVRTRLERPAAKPTL